MIDSTSAIVYKLQKYGCVIQPGCRDEIDRHFVRALAREIPEAEGRIIKALDAVQQTLRRFYTAAIDHLESLGKQRSQENK